MKQILQVFEIPGIFEYLEKRKLLKPYTKAITFLLDGHTASADFKLRKPKYLGIWSFRINKQYRTLCIFENEAQTILKVTEIYDHQ